MAGNLTMTQESYIIPAWHAVSIEIHPINHNIKIILTKHKPKPLRAADKSYIMRISKCEIFGLPVDSERISGSVCRMCQLPDSTGQRRHNTSLLTEYTVQVEALGAHSCCVQKSEYCLPYKKLPPIPELHRWQYVSSRYGENIAQLMVVAMLKLIYWQLSALQ